MANVLAALALAALAMALTLVVMVLGSGIVQHWWKRRQSERKFPRGKA